jgi:hypothetical protein
LRLIVVVADVPTLIIPNGSFDSGDMGSTWRTTERVVPRIVRSPVTRRCSSVLRFTLRETKRIFG